MDADEVERRRRLHARQIADSPLHDMAKRSRQRKAPKLKGKSPNPKSTKEPKP